jgi:two-component system response regulator CpxR
MRILIIDDEVRLARHILNALTTEGHDAVAVHDGEAGLEKAVEETFELIVLDSRCYVVSAPARLLAVFSC